MRRKITPEQRAKILEVYLVDQERAAAMCVEYGLQPTYARRRASDGKIVVSHKIGRKLTDAEKARERSIKRISDADDPRWAWAVERGVVSI